MRRQLAALFLLQTAFGCGTASESTWGAGGVSGGDSASPASSGADVGGQAQVSDPGRKDLHRLNSTEYNATIADALGSTLQPANANWRGGELAGFDNIASVLGVDDAQYNRYFDAAKAIASEAMAEDKRWARFGSCDVGEAGCANARIAAAGLRLFRRPLGSDELQTYQHVYDTARNLGDDDSAALALVVQALLSSAEFLYRIELDPSPDTTEVHPLSGFELATRLSYFLWSSAPDEELLARAADGSLTDPALLAAEVDRLLDDAKSTRFVENFAGQWLGARQVLGHPADPKFYQWSPQVARAASHEILLYFGEFLKTGRSWFEFPEADINFITEPLSWVYGIPTKLTGFDAYERVEYKDDERAGFFGLAGFLAVSSLDRRTSPSRRGRWIAGTLLCAELQPPPDVPKLEETSAGGNGSTNVRATLEAHRKNPSCAGCHAIFDPYGLSLEAYDAIGVHRATYEDGSPVDATVTLPPSPAHPEGLSVEGLSGLAHAIASEPEFGACLAQKLFTYGLGRPLKPSDESHLAQALEKWRSPGETPSIRRLIHQVVSADSFRLRRGGD